MAAYIEVNNKPVRISMFLEKNGSKNVNAYKPWFIECSAMMVKLAAKNKATSRPWLLLLLQMMQML